MPTIIAQDTFNRTLASGSWGSANIGGTWTDAGGSSAFSVDPGSGKMSLQPSWVREMYLNSVSSVNTVSRVSFSSNSVYSGSPQAFTVVGRKLSSSTFYQARVRIENGLLRLYTMRDETALTGSTTITHTYVPGEVIWCELSVTGTNPTTVAAKMWLAGDAEPGSYQQSTADSTTGYQVSAPVGLKGQIGASAPNTILSFTSYTVTDPTITTLATPAVSLTQVSPTTIGGTNGSVTATWPAVAGANHYETCLVSGTVTSGFTADDTNATSPKTYTGLAAGTYTVAVRAKAS